MSTPCNSTGGDWKSLHKAPVYRHDATARTVRRKKRPPHWGRIDDSVYLSTDGGPRLERSVIRVRSCHGRAVHPTQKPEGIIFPLLAYSVPEGGSVLDPFMGSGATGHASRAAGLRFTGIEADERYCELAAKSFQVGQ